MTASHLGPIPPRGPPLSRTVSGHAPTRFGDEAEVEEVEEELEEYGSDYGDLEDNGFDGNEACVDPELQDGFEDAFLQEPDGDDCVDGEGEGADAEWDAHKEQSSVDGNRLKRKLTDMSGERKQRRVDPVNRVQALMTKWRAADDSAVKYVLGTATEDEVATLQKTGWAPRTSPGAKSAAEQVNEALIRNRERAGPHGGSLDVVAAFRCRWKLNKEDDKLLRTLNHKDLRYVIREYDGTRPISDIVDEASMTYPGEEGNTADAAPDRPGLLTLTRFNRLELIDPIADALVVGDANLTFAILLAQHRKALGHVGRIVATTFEKIETLRERYTEIDETIQILEDHMAEVLHDVDCTRLAVDPRFKEMEKFGAVYYNFPHAGVVKGFYDGHPFVRWRHENLMQLFFRALRAFVKPGGIVKVSSNSSAMGVRYSDIILAAEGNEFKHVETLPFLEWTLRGYRRSYGDRRDTERRPDDGEIYRAQKANSDMVYAFTYVPSGKTLPELVVRNPPTKQDLISAEEGRLKGLRGDVKKRKVEEIYKLFLSYVKGVHVG